MGLQINYQIDLDSFRCFGTYDPRLCTDDSGCEHISVCKRESGIELGILRYKRGIELEEWKI